MKTQRTADIAVGFFLALLGFVAILAALKIQGSAEVRLHPGTLPYILGWTLLGAGLLLAGEAWRFRERDRPIQWPDTLGTLRVLVTLGSLTVYLALMFPLGMPLSTFVFMVFLVWYLGRYRVVTAVLIALASAASVYLLFIRLLELPFPVGPLGR